MYANVCFSSLLIDGLLIWVLTFSDTVSVILDDITLEFTNADAQFYSTNLLNKMSQNDRSKLFGVKKVVIDIKKTSEQVEFKFKLDIRGCVKPKSTVQPTTAPTTVYSTKVSTTPYGKSSYKCFFKSINRFISLCITYLIFLSRGQKTGYYKTNGT